MTNTLRTWLTAAASITVLAACGGGGGGPADPLAGVPDEARRSSGEFIAYVKALVASPSETHEPASTEGFQAPASEDTEPEALT